MISWIPWLILGGSLAFNIGMAVHYRRLARRSGCIRLDFDVPKTLKFAAGPHAFTAHGKSKVELRWNGSDWEEVP